MAYLTIHSEAYGKDLFKSILKSTKGFILISFKSDTLNPLSIMNVPLHATVLDTGEGTDWIVGQPAGCSDRQMPDKAWGSC